MSRLRSFILGSLAMVAPACGGSSTSHDTSPGKFSSGLPATAPLESLSQTDAQKLCDAEQSYGGTCIAVGNTQAALSVVFGVPTDNASLQKVCSDAETKCESATGDTSDAGTNACRKSVSGCAATVSDLEACLNSYAACDSITATDFTNAGDGGPVAAIAGVSTAACNTLLKECPDFQVSARSGPTGL